MAGARQRRLDRFRLRDGPFLILALDHPASVGAIHGLDDLADWLRFVDATTLTGAVVNLGAATHVTYALRKGLILQMMALPNGSPAGRRRVPVGTIESAIATGADAISTQLWLEDPALAESVEDVTGLVHSAHRYALPVLLMISDPPTTTAAHFDVADKIRIAAELGADLIKIGLPSTVDGELANKLERTLRHAPPVLVSGGERADPLRQKLETAAALGFAGACIGRHVFQAESPHAVVQEIAGAWSGTS